ncbi:MAG TPA: TetR/AcrR family transcriptional regulator [Pyrinomonadaceae bacterium]|jgi:AcrR family transcriptional regulator
MPKLSQAVIEEKKIVIEDAAKELFIKQGFHAAPMREIARRADVSLGNLYNYYRTKEAILESIIEKYLLVINEKLREIFDEIDEPFESENLLKMSRAVGDVVNQHHDFWLLMYIDVLEFQNRHFRKMFENLATNFRRRFDAKFEATKKRGELHPSIDPALAFTAVYMQFFNYFLVEKLFGGNLHYGLDDDAVMKSLTEIFCRGVASPRKLAEIEKTKSKAKLKV